MNIINEVLLWLTDNIGFVTLLVGGSAIVLYIKQKRDYRRDAAGLIVQEVRFAESQIRQFRAANSYPLSSTILPTSSWPRNVNLFISDLTESEIDLISTFYSQANYIGILINKISDIKVAPSGFSQSQEASSPKPIQVPPLGVNPNPAMPQQVQFVLSSPVIPPDANAQVLLSTVSERIEFIFNSPAIDKLSKIATKKWYQFWL